MRIAVIAGATRGIGAALVEQLARLWGDNGFVYLTARRAADGEEAVKRLARMGLRAGWPPGAPSRPARARGPPPARRPSRARRAPGRGGRGRRGARGRVHPRPPRTGSCGCRAAWPGTPD
eukprot:gene55963-76710_t